MTQKLSPKVTCQYHDLHLELHKFPLSPSYLYVLKSHSSDSSTQADLSKGPPNSVDRSTLTSATTDSDSAVPTTDSSSRVKGSNISDKAAGILKKKAPALTDKELNPEFFQKLEARGSGELPVEVVVARRCLKSSNSQSENESEMNDLEARRSKDCQLDDQTTKNRSTERGTGQVLRQREFDDKSDLRESPANRAGFPKTDGQSEGFMSNKGNWLAIQRQLLQLERQQAHLMNMLQVSRLKFIHGILVIFYLLTLLDCRISWVVPMMAW